MIHHKPYQYFYIHTIDNNVDHLHDPEKMLDISKLVNDGREVTTELITEVTFIKGPCSNKFSKDSKPRIYNFTLDSFEKHDSIPSIAAVLEQCLAERKEEDVVILVNNMLEVDLVQSALDILRKTSKLYVPYLRTTSPKSEEKQKLLDELNSNNELILLTDYRSFRGCEASHSIILTDFDKPIGANIMAEMLSRTMADLDFIVLPKKNPTSYVNPIKQAFDNWQTRGWVQTTIVEFYDEDEFNITFQLNDSCKSKLIEIEKSLSGFKLSESNENQDSNNYL